MVSWYFSEVKPDIKDHPLPPTLGQGTSLPAESTCASQHIIQQALFGSIPPGPLWGLEALLETEIYLTYTDI